MSAPAASKCAAGAGNQCSSSRNSDQDPWLALDFGAQVPVGRVVINKRGNVTGLNKLVVRVADELPVSGDKEFTGGEELGTRKEEEGRVTVTSSAELSGRFVIVQNVDQQGAIGVERDQVTVFSGKQGIHSE